MKKSIFLITLLSLGVSYEASAALGSPFPSSSPNEVSEPAPQSTTLRASNSAQNRMQQSRTGGTSAGGGWVEPKAPIEAGGVVHTPYFEYNYINIDADAGAATNSGHEHVYAIGYDLSWDSGLIVGLTYEYGDRRLYGTPAAPGRMSLDSHTIAGYASAPVIGELVASLVGGYNDGDFGAALIPAANFSGESWFINPGLSHTWTLGNVILNAGVSYLYTDTDTTIGGATVNTDTGQIIAETGARVNVTDIVYVSGGIQYNGVTSHDFAPAAVDESWWRVQTEIGADLANGMTVYGGYARDFAHDFYDVDTVRFGLMYQY